MSDGAFEDTTKAVLRPRREGKDMKIKETVLKRRDRNLKNNAENAKKIQKERKKKRNGKKINKLVTPAKLVKQAIVRKRDQKRLKRVEKKKSSTINEANGRVLVCVRNRRKNPTDAVKPLLQKFRLQKCGTLVFLPYTEETLKKLNVIEPFVYWGFPSFKTVKDVLHRKATFKKNNNEEVVLSNNGIIEEHLGELGVLCVEDLVDVLYHRKEPVFESCSRQLAPFQLGDYTNTKAEGFKVDTKIHPFGNLGRKVNTKVQEVL